MKKISNQRKEKLLGEKEERDRMRKMFLEIWDERQDEKGYCYCFETGKRMHKRDYRELSTVYDHVLEKQANAYPQYKFTKKNIVIILPGVHYQKGANIDFTPKIKAYRDYLLTLHQNGELND